MERYAAFLKVVELGSFTKAAQMLGYTQPALSQMIASLERELSMQLLHRSRYGVELSPEGARLYPAIRSAVAQYEAMRCTADEIRGLDSGLVRIGTVSSVSCHLLPDVIRTFWQKHPNVQLTLRQGDYTSIQDWVRTGAADFGFANPNAVTGLETLPFQTGEFRAVLPTGHPLAVRETVPLAALAEEPLLLLEEGAYNEPLEAFRAAGLSPNIRLCVHDDYSILSMVEQGLGVSILTELVLRRTNYAVVTRPLDPPVIRTLSVVTKDRQRMTLASRAFLDELLRSRERL